MIDTFWAWILMIVMIVIAVLILYYYVMWLFLKSAVKAGMKEAIGELIANNVITPNVNINSTNTER